MKNIIFDLGGVILKDKPISVLDNFIMEKDIYDKLRLFFSNWNELDLGNKTLLEKYNELNYSIDFDQYKDRLVNYFLYRDMNIELLNKIRILKKNGYKVYVLSDNNVDASKYYKENFEDVDGWVMSCDYHTLKKDGKLFDILLDMFDLEPSECYFIDDRNENIIEARKHNIKGFMFNNNINLLIKDMRKNNIKI